MEAALLFVSAPAAKSRCVKRPPGRSAPECSVSEQAPRFAPDDAAATECYLRAMRALKAAGIEFLVGGA